MSQPAQGLLDGFDLPGIGTIKYTPPTIIIIIPITLLIKALIIF